MCTNFNDNYPCGLSMSILAQDSVGSVLNLVEHLANLANLY